jgi:hypothetical protein
MKLSFVNTTAPLSRTHTAKGDEGETRWGGREGGGGCYDVLSSSRSVFRERERESETDRQNCDRLSVENIAG